MQRIVMTVLFLPTLAIGASFDCKMAATRVERLICANTELSWLDDTLSEAFLLEVERTEFPAPLRTAQKVWLASRNGCADCFISGHRHLLNSSSGLNLDIPYGSRHDADMNAIFLQRR